MKITEARRRRRSLYLLVLEDGRELLVDRRTFDESPHRVGGSLSEEQLEALLCRSEYNRAHDKALYLLSLRDYAGRELEKKLTGEATPAVAAAVVERLRAVGLLDDAAYARRTADSLVRYKQYPRRRVEQELLRRGIDRETAREAAQEADCDDLQQALALVRKKYYNKLSDDAARARTAAALARYGFGYDTVRRAMEAATEEES